MYSSAANLKARVGPRLYAQLTAEAAGADADTGTDSVATAKLAQASGEIDILLSGRYVVPITGPAAVLSSLAGYEEQIALWFLWGAYRGIGDQDSAAGAAKADSDRVFDTLNKIADGDLDLPGATLRPADTAAGGWSSNAPVYTKDNFRALG